MQIKKNPSQAEWDLFINSLITPVSFLQSWEYGELELLQKDKNLRLLVMDGKKPILAARFVEMPVPLFHKVRLYCPFGPIGDIDNSEAVKTLLNFVSDYTKNHKEILTVDFDLPFEREEQEQFGSFLDFIDSFGYKKSEFTTLPRCTVVLELTQTEEELWKACKEKTRYNINLARRKGVEIKIFEKPDWDVFWRIIEETTQRQKVVIRSKKFFENFGKAFDYTKFLTVFGAYYQGELIATLFTVGYRDKATYYYGGTSNSHRNTMANYLLQWEVIKYLKNRGVKYYDLWGIVDGTEHTKGWEGITRFKRGFRGKEVEYVGFYRKVCQPLLYFTYLTTKKFRDRFLG